MAGERLLERDDSEWIGQHIIGISNVARKDLRKETLFALRESLRLNPFNIDDRLNLAEYHLHKGEISEMVSEAEAYIAEKEAKKADKTVASIFVAIGSALAPPPWAPEETLGI